MKKIHCIIRNETVVWTPEEVVRQKTIAWLLNRGIPKSQIHVELGMTPWDRSSRDRMDIVVMHPQLNFVEGEFWALVECKRPKGNLSDALDQMRRYGYRLSAHLGLLTDGTQLQIFDIRKGWKAINQLPSWKEYL